MEYFIISDMINGIIYSFGKLDLFGICIKIRVPIIFTILIQYKIDYFIINIYYMNKISYNNAAI
jgi:hypothetical protein